MRWSGRSGIPATTPPRPASSACQPAPPSRPATPTTFQAGFSSSRSRSRASPSATEAPHGHGPSSATTVARRKSTNIAALATTAPVLLVSVVRVQRDLQGLHLRRRLPGNLQRLRAGAPVPTAGELCQPRRTVPAVLLDRASLSQAGPQRGPAESRGLSAVAPSARWLGTRGVVRVALALVPEQLRVARDVLAEWRAGLTGGLALALILGSGTRVLARAVPPAWPENGRGTD